MLDCTGILELAIRIAIHHATLGGDEAIVMCNEDCRSDYCSQVISDPGDRQGHLSSLLST